MTGWYAERTSDTSAKAVIAVTLLALLLVAVAGPVALLAGVVMMLLGHVVGGLALFGGLYPRRRNSCRSRRHQRDAAPAQAGRRAQLRVVQLDGSQYTDVAEPAGWRRSPLLCSWTAASTPKSADLLRRPQSPPGRRPRCGSTDIPRSRLRQFAHRKPTAVGIPVPSGPQSHQEMEVAVADVLAEPADEGGRVVMGAFDVHGRPVPAETPSRSHSAVPLTEMPPGLREVRVRLEPEPASDPATPGGL